MLARLQVLPLAARRFFFDHTSQGKWLMVTWVTWLIIVDFEKAASANILQGHMSHMSHRRSFWRMSMTWLLFLSRPKSRVCKSLHSEIQSYKQVISVISFWRMPGQPTFFWATFSPKSATVASKKEDLIVRVLQVNYFHMFSSALPLENTNVFPFVACFSVGPELGHTAIEGNHPDNATSESLRVVFSPNI